MNIIVCVKQVPDTNEVRIDQKTGTLIREGVPSIINPDDKNAIEEALVLRADYGGKVVVVSMGPPQAKNALKEAVAMGVDETYLITDRVFGGSDTWATATIIAEAIEHIAKDIGGYDIIFCGRQAIDGDTAQVGPEIAEFLNIPQITYTKKIEVVEEGRLMVTRGAENADYVIEVKTPVLLTAIKELNNPRYMTCRGIAKAFNLAYDSKINVFTQEDLQVDLTQIGVKNSPTNVYRSFVPVKEKNTEIIEGLNAKDMSAALIGKLQEKKLI